LVLAHAAIEDCSQSASHDAGLPQSRILHNHNTGEPARRAAGISGGMGQFLSSSGQALSWPLSHPFGTALSGESNVGTPVRQWPDSSIDYWGTFTGTRCGSAIAFCRCAKVFRNANMIIIKGLLNGWAGSPEYAALKRVLASQFFLILLLGDLGINSNAILS
jgi:hypothetical protein